MKTLYLKRTRQAWEDKPIDTSALKSDCTEMLVQLIVQGPVYDGDVVSKNLRDQLIAAGFAAKVIINQKEAGTCATYYGNHLFCQLMDVDTLKEGLAKLEAMGGLQGLFETLKIVSHEEEACAVRS
jgi:hypothetical protein